jgi:hypothetical protein
VALALVTGSWSTIVKPACPVRCSVADTAQKPAVADREYVRVARPVWSVVTLAAWRVPQAAAGSPIVASVTSSPETRFGGVQQVV